MEYTYQRKYRGPIKLVILDWAGTTIDYGCYAPAVVFIEVFKRRGVEITMEQARRPMGLKKIDHIRAILKQDEVAQLWRKVHGREGTEDDVRDMSVSSIFIMIKKDSVENLFCTRIIN